MRRRKGRNTGTRGEKGEKEEEGRARATIAFLSRAPGDLHGPRLEPGKRGGGEMREKRKIHQGKRGGEQKREGLNR